MNRWDVARVIAAEKMLGWPSQDELLGYLPDAQSVADDRVRGALVNDGQWRPWTCGFVIGARACENRREFERLVGAYKNGYRGNFGAILRGMFYHDGVESLAREQGINTDDPDYMVKTKPIQRDMRYALRWLFYRVKEAQSTEGARGGAR